VFFENPWAKNPISSDIKRKILNIAGMRIDYSWFQYGDSILDYRIIEDELEKAKWLCDVVG
ncbi:MAG: hypothetical protein ACRCYN_13040, partial [Plesiomonas sp.]